MRPKGRLLAHFMMISFPRLEKCALQPQGFETAIVSYWYSLGIQMFLSTLTLLTDEAAK